MNVQKLNFLDLKILRTGPSHTMNLQNLLCAMEEVLLVGDIHGELKTIVWKLTQQYKVKDRNVIFLGDFGVGFGRPGSLKHEYQKIERKLEKNNLTFWVLRGNHDDPSYFDGQHDLPRIKFLQDHQVIEIGGWKVYPIGGAQSTDQEWRVSKNQEMERLGSSLRCWWPGESVVQKDPTEIPPYSDLVISHTAPIDFSPTCSRLGDMSTEVYEKIVQERVYLSTVLHETRTKYWFYGHFHKSFSGGIGDMLWRGLGINEIYELRCQN